LSLLFEDIFLRIHANIETAVKILAIFRTKGECYGENVNSAIPTGKVEFKLLLISILFSGCELSMKQLGLFGAERHMINCIKYA